LLIIVVFAAFNYNYNDIYLFIHSFIYYVDLILLIKDVL